mgnify:CR=1 FL=1
MKVLNVVGARPNMMKIAPIMRALAAEDGVQQKLLHTGQHYDVEMNDAFFTQLQIPPPDIELEVGSASHAARDKTRPLRIGYSPPEHGCR